MKNQIIQGDCLEVLRTFPSDYVQTCVTSPPYFGLRDYGCDGQIGLEETPQEFIEKLVQVFREVRRVLRPDGTLWLNIGDTYAANRSYQVNDNKVGNVGNHLPSKVPSGLKPKDLMMIPARVAIALCSDGWYLRSDIIWHKTNAMPESVQDRPTKAHEYVFLLAKSERYFYNIDAIREPHNGTSGWAKQRAKGINTWEYGRTGNERIGADRQGESTFEHPAGRNKRSVWDISTVPFPEAHFAVMSPDLARLCILAGSTPDSIVLDPFSGAGTTAYVASKLGRAYLGIELNPEYVKLSHKRLSGLAVGLWGFSEDIA